MSKHINEMTRKEFDAVPWRSNWNIDVECSTLVILPMQKRHDSGYRLLDLVATKDGKPLCRLSGCSDVIHVDGIGGRGYRWLEKYNKCPSLIPPSGWSIDCLPKSGLLQMWPTNHRIICGSALSSFEIFSLEREKVSS